MTIRVFIGSTSRDLTEYRKAAIDTCLKLDMFPVAMEYFEAIPAGATEGSKRKVDESDLYVGVYAFRYGYIEDGYDKSVTEIEFDYAGERGLDRLCFLADENHPWPPGATDPKNWDKLEAFKKRIDASLIRAQFTTVDNFAAVLMHALVKWKEAHPEDKPATGGRSGGMEANILTQPADVWQAPRDLIGRDDLLKTVRAYLDDGQMVLLHGLGGTGKTALAATVTKGWLAKKKKQPVVWLKMGSSGADELLEALARPFGAAQTIAAAGEAKINVLRGVLAKAGVKLLVLDDAWNGAALFQVLQAIPGGLPVLVTSRQTYPLDGEFVHVPDLALDKAVELLGKLAGKNYADTEATGTDEGAADLCDTLGNLAFAVEIAGKTLKTRHQTPGQLLEAIQDAPHQLAIPLDFAEEGRRCFADLLAVSLDVVREKDPAAFDVFLAFGAFFSPTATVELLALYRNTESVDAALNTLTDYGLVELTPKTGDSVAYYGLHDLVYAYAQAQNGNDQKDRALQACLDYTWRYNEPSPENFAALRPELDNFLGAADWAFTQGRWADCEQFAWNLNSVSGSKIMDYQGYYTQAVRLLEQAAQAAEQRDDQRDQGAHLTYLGNAYANLGQYEQAIDHYEQALAIAREIGDQEGEGRHLGNLGVAYKDLRRYEQAIDHYEQALAIAREIGDRRGEGVALGNLGIAYAKRGQYDKAIDYYQQALAIAREIGDRRGEGNDLGNLGNAYADLGQYEQAIAYYAQARAIYAALGLAHLVERTDNNIADTRREMGGAE